MANYCLPPILRDTFRNAIKSGKIDPDVLHDMPSAERKSALEEVLGAKDAKGVNSLFENRIQVERNQEQAMIDKNKEKGIEGLTDAQKSRFLEKQNEGLQNLIKKTLDPKTPAARDMISRVQRMDNILSPKDTQSILTELASKKLGMDVSDEEINNISEKSKAISEAEKNEPIEPPTVEDIKKYNKTKGKEGRPAEGVSPELVKARLDFKNYMESLKPEDAAKTIIGDVGNIMKNMLITFPKTFIKSMAGQFSSGSFEKVLMRMSNLTIQGLNPELSRDINGSATKFFHDTKIGGQSITSLNDIGNNNVLGEKNLIRPTGKVEGGNIATKIEKVTGATSRFSDKYIINKQHVAPMMYNFNRIFSDSLNILSTGDVNKIGLEGDAAKTEAGKRMLDAARIEPQTMEGKILRAKAQMLAGRVVGIDKTALSQFNVSLKNSLNQLGMKANIPLGNLIMPVAAMPANLLQYGIQNSPIGIVTGYLDRAEGIEKMKSSDPQTIVEGNVQWTRGVMQMKRSLGVTALGAVMGSLIPLQNTRIDEYGNTYVRFSDNSPWINMSYMSFVLPTFGATIGVRNGQGLVGKGEGYLKGTFSGLNDLPGLGEAYQWSKNIADGTGIEYITGEASQRVAPSVTYDTIHAFGDGQPTDGWSRAYRILTGTGIETQDEVDADNENKSEKSASKRTKNNNSNFRI